MKNKLDIFPANSFLDWILQSGASFLFSLFKWDSRHMKNYMSQRKKKKANLYTA